MSREVNKSTCPIFRVHYTPMLRLKLLRALFMARMKREDVPMVENEKPEHHPSNDARYSGRLFWKAYHRSGK